jgi:hypothetical protein
MREYGKVLLCVALGESLLIARQAGACLERVVCRSRAMLIDLAKTKTAPIKYQHYQHIRIRLLQKCGWEITIFTR